MKDLLRRVSRLERALVPPEPWRITIEYADGSVGVVSAREYRKIKEKYLHDVHVIDRTISGNLDELDDWLQMVRFVASLDFPDDKEQCVPDITELDDWVATASQTAVTAI